MIKIAGINKESTMDGEGFRTVIYMQGCNHACKGCHNKNTWSKDGGKELTKEELEKIINNINDDPIKDGITLSGGDPFYEPEKLLTLLEFLRKKLSKDKTIWVYTGYTLEELKQNKTMSRCLTFIDVLVDGKFIEKLRDKTLKFVGSSNQRIIKLKE